MISAAAPGTIQTSTVVLFKARRSMKHSRISLRPKLFWKHLYKSKDGVLAQLSCSFSASHSYTYTHIHTFHCPPLSLSAGAELTFRLLPPCWRHTLAHKLWSSLELILWCIYLSPPAPAPSRTGQASFFIWCQRQLWWRHQLTGHQSRVESPSESVISNRAWCVYVCMAAGVSEPAHQGLSRIKVAKVSGLYSS